MLRCRLSKAAAATTAASSCCCKTITKAAASALGARGFTSSSSSSDDVVFVYNKHCHHYSIPKRMLPFTPGSSSASNAMKQSLLLVDADQKRYFGLGRARPSARFPAPFESENSDLDVDDDDVDDDLDSDYEDDLFIVSQKQSKAKEAAAKAKAKAQEEEEEEERRRLEIQKELDAKTGRLWTDDWELTDELWSSNVSWDDIPDWDRSLCSRVSKERVQVYEGGIPTLQTLSTISLPKPPPAHPTYTYPKNAPKKYAKFRKNHHAAQIHQTLSSLLNPSQHIAPILSLQNWQEKQNAVDNLFEEMYEKVKEKETVLKSHPLFRDWVDEALEDCLKEFVAKSQEEEKESSSSSSSNKNEDETNKNDDNTPTTSKDYDDNDSKQQEAVPIFMDLLTPKSTFQGGTPQYKPINTETADAKSKNEENKVVVIPSILYPLTISSKGLEGRMVEEWELTADDDRRRIMMRECMSEIAKSVLEGSEEGGKRVFVSGKQGVGKTAALAAIVASARTSDNIVLYLPDGDRLRKLGFYIEPNTHRKGLYDLPVLAKEVCTQLLTSHKHDMEGMTVSHEDLKQFCTRDQISKLRDTSDDENDKEEEGPISLIHLLTSGSTSNSLSSSCYSAAIHMLMNQTTKPFVVVMDEFNCFYDYGHYFHEQYDEMVYKSIPCNIITLFKPLLEAMAISPGLSIDKNNRKSLPPPQREDAVLMKRGAIVVATSESRAVARKFTDGLHDAAVKDEGVRVVNVPRYSKVEVDHILAHFEVVGIGRLRFDRGDTVMNEQEVAYLNMVSGGVGQNLLNACIV